MRYCDKCGAAITSGGHKSHFGSFAGTPFLCADCYAVEDKNVNTVAMFVVRLVVGLFIGLGGAMGLAGVMDKICGGFSNTVQTGVAIGMETVLIVGYIACKIGRMRLQSRFVKFLLGVASFPLFWVALAFGGALALILKHGA